MKHTHRFALFLSAMLYGALSAMASAQSMPPENTNKSSVLRTSEGKPIFTAQGGCIADPDEQVTDPDCLPAPEPERIIITTLPPDDPANDPINYPHYGPPEKQASSQTGSPPEVEPALLSEKTVHFVTQIPFGLNDAGLSSGQRAGLLQFLFSLEDYFKVLSVTIIGHSDASGTAHYNEWLSKKRARSVQIYFRSLGVDPRTMIIQGAGESALLPNREPAAAAQRRVEIVALVQTHPK